MIRVEKNEQFPITALMIDEWTGDIISDATVDYKICDISDNIVDTGYLSESTTESGIYGNLASLSVAGIYRVFITCSGYSPGVEDIIVNSENIYDLTKQNRHYNISVEDVLRTNINPTASQTSRNVPFNKTDYIINKIKPDFSSDWDSYSTVSGMIYAHYRSIDDEVPYKMGADS